MARAVFIYGRSGSGKSSGIRTLPVEQTFIVNINGKELPFKGSQKYITLNSDSYETINNQLSKVDKEEKNKHIKYVIIDDSQYLMVNQFMKMHSSTSKGNDIFALYNNIGDRFWNLIFNIRFMREDLTIIFLHHAEKDESGFIKPKTIGKMLDDKVDIAGMFTIVLLAIREGKDNFFITQNDGMHQAKSPMGMFKDERIPNDLLLVCETINNYYSEGSV